jgi:hypothetical protein
MYADWSVLDGRASSRFVPPVPGGRTSTQRLSCSAMYVSSTSTKSSFSVNHSIASS